ncbi:DUF3703 domain-containing protein [Nocardia sp. 2]|uniref:DUF3703 domain-containing protein n=1 Tax=Nocardia acididurans TaxID=2802282 RepID=A0ABS1MAN1_9NOCA|nr:DUF3703 domain-containing protein [Nocardia acididurans]MBL1076824.1 DUF3703 domain-containing protein [Nocardia acididurans]
MAAMPSHIRTAFESELHRARTTSDLDEMWRALERAHILSQRWPWPHTRAHWHMFSLALRTRDRREALGQAVRLSGAGLASSLGRVPIGNTGRATVGIMTPMPIPDDLARILGEPAPGGVTRG